MLALLRYLGKCSEEEVKLYGKALNEHAKTQMEYVPMGENVSHKYKATKALWLKYHPRQKDKPKKVYLKLAPSQAANARKLMEKYKLTDEQIRLTKKQRTEDQVTEFRKRQEDKTTKPPDSDDKDPD